MNRFEKVKKPISPEYNTFITYFKSNRFRYHLSYFFTTVISTGHPVSAVSETIKQLTTPSEFKKTAGVEIPIYIGQYFGRVIAKVVRLGNNQRIYPGPVFVPHRLFESTQKIFDQWNFIARRIFLGT